MNPQRITIFYNPFACTVLLLLPLATKMPSCNAARPPHGGQRGRRDHKHKTIAPSCKHAPQRSKDPQRYTIANAHCVDGVDLIQLTAVPSANALRSKNLCLALWRMEGGRMRLLCVVFRALITMVFNSNAVIQSRALFTHLLNTRGATPWIDGRMPRDCCWPPAGNVCDERRWRTHTARWTQQRRMCGCARRVTINASKNERIDSWSATHRHKAHKAKNLLATLAILFTRYAVWSHLASKFITYNNSIINNCGNTLYEIRLWCLIK